MPQDYATMELLQQVDLIQAELPVMDALAGKAEMWTTAKKEIDEASISLTRSVDRLEPVWTDPAGDGFAVKNRNAVRILDTWSRNIQVNDPRTVLGDLSAKIKDTAANVIRNYNTAQAEITKIEALTQADAEAQKKAIEERYQKLNATELAALDAEYDKAAGKITAAASGGDWEQAPQQGGERPTGTTSATGQSPGGPSGQDQQQSQDGGTAQQQSPSDQQAQQQISQQGGAGEPVGPQAGGPGTDPSLSGGLSGAPTVPPSAFTPSPPLPPATSVPGPGMPLAPVAGLGGLSGFGGRGAGGPRGVSAGGAIRLPGGGIPGVGVSGGQSTIPAAASPVAAPTTPAQATPPATATPVPASSTPGGPGGGGMPMMPPMGGMGAAATGGSGGGPGPGAVQRPGNGRRRPGDPAAGMPSMLRGKAGKKDPHTFVTRSRTAESDIPTTVQLIDEDLWQVERAAGDPGTVIEQAPVRRARP
jgi:hypothetical protein